MKYDIQYAVEHAKPVLDGISIAGIIGTLIGYLPAMAAILSIIWTGLRIYETKTVQDMLKRWRR